MCDHNICFDNCNCGDGMSDEIKQACQKQAEEGYKMFLWFCKWFSYYCIFIMVVLASCNFGVDGTGGKSNGELHEEYKERMGLNE